MATLRTLALFAVMLTGTLGTAKAVHDLVDVHPLLGLAAFILAMTLTLLVAVGLAAVIR